MRHVLVVSILALLPVGSSAQEAPAIALHSFQDTSCGAWATSAGNESSRIQYLTWFRGFVSGYNFANPRNQVALDRMPDYATLSLYVDKYCSETPLKPFPVAAFDLVRELRDHFEIGDGSTPEPDGR